MHVYQVCKLVHEVMCYQCCSFSYSPFSGLSSLKTNVLAVLTLLIPLFQCCTLPFIGKGFIFTMLPRLVFCLCLCLALKPIQRECLCVLSFCSMLRIFVKTPLVMEGIPVSCRFEQRTVLMNAAWQKTRSFHNKECSCKSGVQSHTVMEQMPSGLVGRPFESTGKKCQFHLCGGERERLTKLKEK